MTPTTPLRAVVEGAGAVIKTPMIVVSAALLTLALALPFAAVLGAGLQQSLSAQPAVNLDETEIDPEWWREYREQARGLEATFTPAIVSFAAPLDGFSAVLDGRVPPLAVFGPIALSIVVWAFLWGGALRRYAAGGPIGARAFVAEGFSLMPRFVIIALAAAVAIAILYLTLHPLLFGPVYHFLASRASSEATAFFVRVVLYAVFFAPVAVVGVIADYARISSTLGIARSPGDSLTAAIAFVRTQFGAVTGVYLWWGLIFIVVTVGYGWAEVLGGSRVGGWRAIALGQLYILVRLAVRLGGAASALRLFAARSTQ